MSGYTALFQTSLFIYCRIILAGGSCYNPDQVVPSNPYDPCDSTSGAHSACCDHGDPCTDRGYCIGKSGYPYRGGCTDITWQSPNCAQECRDVALNDQSNLYPCPVNNGSFTTDWCCAEKYGSAESNAGCCNGPLLVDFVVGRILPISSDPSTLSSSSFQSASSSSSGAATATDPNPTTLFSSSSSIVTFPSSTAFSISSSLSNPTLTPTSTPISTSISLETSSTPAQPFRKSLAVGTGIAVPVAGLLLLGLIYLLLRERRRRVRAQKMLDDANTTARTKGTESGSAIARDYELRHQQFLQSPQELEYLPDRTKEVDSQEVYEVKGDS